VEDPGLKGFNFFDVNVVLFLLLKKDWVENNIEKF
jgi:hypothetical protein